MPLEASRTRLTRKPRVFLSYGWQDNVPLLLRLKLGTQESRAGYKDVLVAHFSQHRGLLDEDSLRRLERNPLRILERHGYVFQDIRSGAPITIDELRRRLPRNDTRMSTSMNVVAEVRA